MVEISRTEDSRVPSTNRSAFPEKYVTEEFWGEPIVKKATNLSRTTRWRLEREGKFPRRRKLSPGRCAWLAREILA